MPNISNTYPGTQQFENYFEFLFESPAKYHVQIVTGDTVVWNIPSKNKNKFIS